MARLWKRLQAALLRLGIAGLIIAFIAGIVAVAVVYIGVAYYTGVFPDPDWTGFGPPKLNADGQEIAHFKTLWDWLGLLLVPLVLAVGGFLLTRSENRYALQLQERREEEARKIEEQRGQDAALQAYLDQMTDLLLHENLRTSRPNDEVRSVARARTLTVLRVLDGERKATVLQFLYEAGLIGGIKKEKDISSSTIETAETFDTIVSLEGALLDEARLDRALLNGAYLIDARLDGAYLTGTLLNRTNLLQAHLDGAHLSGAYLIGANLSGAYLIGAYLGVADLTGANLTGANLNGAVLTGALLTVADLTGADLTKCEVTREQLLQAASLEGATLPFDMTPPPAPEVEGDDSQNGQPQRRPSSAPARSTSSGRKRG